MSASISLKELLYSHTLPAADELTRSAGDKKVQCFACAHRCTIAEGRSGVCRVRFNENGQLRVPGGYVAGVQIDPIEKKPFYHVYPGREALSFGMLGCNFHCSFCQNWITSQALRDEQAVAVPRFCDAEQLARLAVDNHVPLAVSTYNEPLISSEWAVEVFKRLTAHGIVCGYVSNGYGTPEVLRFLRPHMQLFKIDLKCFNEANYRRLGGRLQDVLETIRLARQMDFWVEVVTLVVPTFNDNEDEFRRIAEFLAGVSPDIPWHVTAFHPDYKMTDPPRTPAKTLLRAHQIGKAAGLRYVYAGNLAGGAGDCEHTFCPACGSLLIRRRGFYVAQNRVRGGACPDCGERIAGIWEDDPPTVSNGPGLPRPVV